MKVNSELRSLVSGLDLAEESKELLFSTLLGGGETISGSDSTALLCLLDSLRSNRFLGLIPVEKTRLLENLVDLIRQGQKEWVSSVCYVLYEGTLPPWPVSSFLPEAMTVDLLRWVNMDKSDKVRETLWAILLRKDVRLGIAARIADVVTGLFEKDPITRNNIIRFIFDHFSPDEVMDSLFQYSLASGKRIPSVVFKRYASLVKDQEDRQQKKYGLEKILSSAKLDDKDTAQIYSEYMHTLNRFELIRLLSGLTGLHSRFAELECTGDQMGFPFDHGDEALACHNPLRRRISLLMHD
jgi:hypothetical protein